jgi:RNA polymerase sigma-70 factor (ECF subfamily)
VSVARHVLGEPSAAEDCVHDALLRVWQAPNSYTAERGTLRAFLITCVRNEALSRLRSGLRRVERERRAHLLEVDLESNEPADPFDARRVRAALARLPAEQREAIERAYFENLTQNQIAERLGVPLGTVKSRVLLAMRKLRAELGAGS